MPTVRKPKKRENSNFKNIFLGYMTHRTQIMIEIILFITLTIERNYVNFGLQFSFKEGLKSRDRDIL